MLVNKEYIKRCPLPVEKKAVPEFITEPEKEFKPPRVDIPNLVQAASGEAELSNDEVFWYIHFDRFHQDLRDDLLVVAMSRRISAKGGDIMRVALQLMQLKSNPWMAVSNPILVSDLKDYLRKSKADAELINYLEDYLAVIGRLFFLYLCLKIKINFKKNFIYFPAEDPSGFLSRAEMTSPAYHINLKKAVEELTWSVLASGVDAKFGNNAARIFR